MAELAVTPGEGLGRLVVVNWAPEAIGLVRALQGLGAGSLTLIGTHSADAAEAALAGAREQGPVRYLAGSVEAGVGIWVMRVLVFQALDVG